MTKSSRSHFRSADACLALIPALVSGAVVLILSAGVGAAATGTAGAAGQDEHPQLPQGAGRDVMVRVCSKCHDPELAADQQNDKAGWKGLVDQMASKGADATDAEFAQIVDYLATAFPPAK